MHLVGSSIRFGEGALQAIQRFSLDLPSDLETKPQLFFDKSKVPLDLEGRCLEGQWQHEKGYLLVFSEDSPYDDALHLYLIHSQWRVLDHVILAQPYTAGLFREPKLNDSNALDFIFFEGVGRWQVCILEKSRLGILNRPDLPGRRPFSHWFRATYLSLTLQ